MLSRPRRAALAVLASALPLASAPPLQARTLGYVTNGGDIGVSVFDVDSETYLTSIYLCDQPDFCPSFGLARSADGSRVLVTSSAGLMVIDTRRNEVVQRLPFLGLDVAVSPDGRRAFLSGCGATGFGPNRFPVCEVDLAGAFIRAVYANNFGSSRIVTQRAGATAYVTSTLDDQGQGSIEVLNTAAGSVIASVLVPGRAIDVVLRPDDRRAYVLSLPDNLTIIDTEQNEATNHLSLGMPSMRLAFSPDGKRAYATAVSFVGDSRLEAVVVIDTDSETIVDRIQLADEDQFGNKPFGIGLSPNGQRAFVVNNESYDIRVVDVVAGQTLPKTIAAGEGAGEIAIVQVPAAAQSGDGGCSFDSRGRGAWSPGAALLCLIALVRRRMARMS